jgi:hypothetical protein
MLSGGLVPTICPNGGELGGESICAADDLAGNLLTRRGPVLRIGSKRSHNTMSPLEQRVYVSSWLAFKVERLFIAENTASEAFQMRLHRRYV